MYYDCVSDACEWVSGMVYRSEVKGKLQISFSPIFMWVLGIQFMALELCGKHLYPLSHLTSPPNLREKKHSIDQDVNKTSTFIEQDNAEYPSDLK